MTGAFITFEGGEASGKSTQIKCLAKDLTERGYDIVITREPGGEQACEKIRSLLLDHTWQPLTEVFLFAANRYEHSVNLIIPSVKAGKIVLCDRFMDSSMAYQGFGLGMPLELMKNLETYVVPLRPSLTFIIDLDPAIAHVRLQKRGKRNHIDDRALEFHEHVRQGYKHIAIHDPERCVVIDGSQKQEDVYKHILTSTLMHLESLRNLEVLLKES